MVVSGGVWIGSSLLAVLPPPSSFTRCFSVINENSCQALVFALSFLLRTLFSPWGEGGLGLAMR